MKTASIKMSIIVSAVLVLYTACKKNDAVPERTYGLEKQELNISYGAGAAQKMDVYFPEGYNAGTPVIFTLHGGGFIAGSKNEFTDRAKLFMARGFITVNVGYRLVDGSGVADTPPVHKQSAVKVADQVADLAAAVEKYITMAAGWGAGTSRMYMAGHSAGGTLAMLYVQGDKNSEGKVRASCNLGGLANITLPDSFWDNEPEHELWPNAKELMHRLTGVMPSRSTALYYMAISPNWVTTNNKPGKPNISLMPESNDRDLRFEPYFSTIDDAVKYHNQLRSYGTASALVMMKTDHGFSDLPDNWEKAVKVTADFFNRN